MELPRITIKEIEEKEFNIVRTDGYDPQEVDEYLDRIMDEMARQIDEIAMLRQELQAAKARPVVQAPVQPVQPVQPVRRWRSSRWRSASRRRPLPRRRRKPMR